MVENNPDMQFLIRLIIENSVFLPQPDQGSEINKFKDRFITGSTIMGGGIPINEYENRVKRNWNITNIVNLGKDIYDLDEEELTAIEEYARLSDINKEDDNEL